MNILFASSEAHPLIKTGGLADVAGSLPRAIRKLDEEIRLVIPAYRQVLRNTENLCIAAYLELDNVIQPARILSGRLPGSKVKLYLVDSPVYFDRSGNPYTGKDGKDWPDNAKRFSVFCRAIQAIALNQAGLDWQPDIVHCNDWQTGLVPAFLTGSSAAPATVFTIHNLAYQGLFNRRTFNSLKLSPDWWSMDALEFHNQFSFIKGGLVYADWLTTVSPTYADEIRTTEYGCGLEGLLNQRKQNLTGILNGVDYFDWNPWRDKHLTARYNRNTLDQKLVNKLALQKEFALTVDKSIPLFGIISRLVEQKGIDLVLEILPDLVAQGAQLVVLGSGDTTLETALRQAGATHRKQVGIHIGYDEALSHRIEAGADIFLMPSRFEPCGLNQIYSQHYGTVPIVRSTGGLTDTVVDTSPESLKNKTATGFRFQKASAVALWSAVQQALKHYRDVGTWVQIIDTGMQQDFSWKRSAEQYIELYRAILASRKIPRNDIIPRKSDDLKSIT